MWHACMFRAAGSKLDLGLMLVININMIQSLAARQKTVMAPDTMMMALHTPLRACPNTSWKEVETSLSQFAL